MCPLSLKSYLCSFRADHRGWCSPSSTTRRFGRASYDPRADGCRVDAELVAVTRRVLGPGGPAPTGVPTFYTMTRGDIVKIDAAVRKVYSSQRCTRTRTPYQGLLRLRAGGHVEWPSMAGLHSRSYSCSQHMLCHPGQSAQRPPLRGGRSPTSTASHSQCASAVFSGTCIASPTVCASAGGPFWVGHLNRAFSRQPPGAPRSGGIASF